MTVPGVAHCPRWAPRWPPSPVDPVAAAAATLTLLLLLLAGCAADAGTPAQPVEGLLVLTKGDVANLAVLAARRDPSKTVAIGLPLPANDMTWISAGDGRRAPRQHGRGCRGDQRRGRSARLRRRHRGARVEAGRGHGRERRRAAAGPLRDLGAGWRPVRRDRRGPGRRRRCQRPPGRPEGRHATRRSPSIDPSSPDRRSGSTPIGWPS